MGDIKVYLLILLMVVSEGVSQDEQCDDESRVKLSILSAQRYSLRAKNREIMNLQAELEKMETYLEEADTLITEIENKTTPDTLQLETSCAGASVRDCCEVKKILPSVVTGIYAIRDPCAGDNTFNYGKINVNCDMETDCGGWIVIQRRNASLGTVNFTRNWEDYENGFGDLDGEFWIGLRNIHELTNQHDVDLQISVWNDADTSITWNYLTFRVAGPEQKYQLTVSGGTGDGGRDAFAYNNGQYFSTYDRDNDNHGHINCGYYDQAGWWYNQCTYVNLNGRHEISGLPGTGHTEQRLFWFSGGRVFFTNSEIKIRSKTCSLDC
jgi:hypothetical protein